MIRLKPAALAGAVLLGACSNQVVTDRPLFSKVDAVGAPRIRAGVWNIATPSCGFDEAKPQNAWPSCANPMAPITDPPPWFTVAGRPALIQSKAPEGPDAPTTAVSYLAFRVIRSDPEGRATEIAFWFVQCGPPPAADQSGLTKHLLPGLTPRTDSKNCTTTSKAAVRGAAKASEAWMAGPPPRMHWIRDPIPGDRPSDNSDYAM